MQFKHGQKVTCEIHGVKITDAKISIGKYGKPCICQNRKDGFNADDKLGYKYSWVLSADFTCGGVTNLKPVNKTLNELETGDTVIDEEGDEYFVMGVAGKMVWLSDDENEATSTAYTTPYTLKELERLEYKVKGEEPEVTELSMDEIADKFGVSVKQLKIKKD
jgi:hypothetical protein